MVTENSLKSKEQNLNSNGYSDGDEVQPTIFGFPKYPAFQMGQPRFPQTTFMGRYLHYLDVIDPCTLFASNEKVENSLKLLENYAKNPKAINATNQQLWEAQKLKQAIYHPDTNEVILPPFRMSGFVPFGWITVTGMLLPNPSWSTMLFWQWVNQSHNACVNYANRNATKPQPFSAYTKAYLAAVSTAMGVSASLTYVIRRSQNLSATKKLILQRFIPLPATSLASTLNVLFMRAPEIQSGIDVFDENGNYVGTSKKAAKKAVIDTALTRAFLPVPLLFLPPCIMPFFEKIKTVRTRPLIHLCVNAIVCTISFAFSLPISLALFPQLCKIRVDQLEEEFTQLTKNEMLYYNRGL